MNLDIFQEESPKKSVEDTEDVTWFLLAPYSKMQVEWGKQEERI